MSDPQRQTDEQQREQNLTRSRHNQRRSRQKKKEYVSDLEARNRELKSKGVQASAEMQAAARKVANENSTLREENTRIQAENLRLRRLLAHAGVSEAEVEHQIGPQRAISGSSLPTSPTSGLQFSTASENLQGLLSQKIPSQAADDASGALSPTQAQGPIRRTGHTQVQQRAGPALPRLDIAAREEMLPARPPEHPTILASSRSSFSESAGPPEEYNSVSQAESGSVYPLAQQHQEMFAMTPVAQYPMMPRWPSAPTYQTVPHTQPGALAMPQRVATMTPLHGTTTPMHNMAPPLHEQPPTMHNVVSPPPLHHPTAPLHGATAMYGQISPTGDNSTLHAAIPETRTEQHDTIGYQSAHRFPPGGTQGYG